MDEGYLLTKQESTITHISTSNYLPFSSPKACNPKLFSKQAMNNSYKHNQNANTRNT